MEIEFLNQSVQKLEEEITLQKQRMVEIAQKKRSYIQYDDLLQPQDFPDIDSDPDFRFEEGLLYGLERALVIVRSLLQKM